MSAESNKQLMSRFTELMNSANPVLAKELISPSALFHIPVRGGSRSEPVLGPEGYLAVLGVLRSGFPDIRWTLEDFAADESRLAARFTVRGTHIGTFLGTRATGRTIAVRSIGFYRLLGGKILEEFQQPEFRTYLRWVGPSARSRGRRRLADSSPQAICRNRSSLAFRYPGES